MEWSDQRELASFYLLFLAAMLAGFFYAQKSRAQITKSVAHLRRPATVEAAPAGPTTSSSTPNPIVAKAEPMGQTLVIVPDLPILTFDIPLVSSYLKEFGFGVLDFISGFSSTRITSTDNNTLANASLVSKDNVNLGLRYQHLLTSAFRTIFTIEDKRLDFLTPVSGALMTPSINLISYSVGGQFDLAKDLHVSLTIGAEQVPFLKGISLTQVTIDQLSVPDASVYFSWDILDRHPFRLGAEGFLRTYFPSSSDTYQSNTNLGFGGRLYIRQNVSSNLRFDLGLNAQVLNQNTTIVHQQQTDYGVDLKVSIPIGGTFQ